MECITKSKNNTKKNNERKKNEINNKPFLRKHLLDENKRTEICYYAVSLIAFLYIKTFDKYLIELN